MLILVHLEICFTRKFNCCRRNTTKIFLYCFLKKYRISWKQRNRNGTLLLNAFSWNSEFSNIFENFYPKTERTCINKVDDLLNIFMSQIAEINHAKVCCCIWLKSEIRHILTSIKIFLNVQSINQNKYILSIEWSPKLIPGELRIYCAGANHKHSTNLESNLR